MATWYSSKKIGNITYNRGDTVYVNGTGHVSAYAGSSTGIDYGTSYETVFYGYYEDSNNSIPYPVCCGYWANGVVQPNYYLTTSQIIGKTPVAVGNFVAYVKDRNRQGSTENVPGTWFESIYLDWNNWGGANDGGIKGYEIWYRESSDGSTWSDRVSARGNITTTNNYGSCTLGEVDQTTNVSNWGIRGKYYQWCVVALTNNGHWSDTGFWSSTYRKCTCTAYTFNANNGSGAPATQYKFPGYHFKFPSTKPTRTGYTFTGWSQSGSTTKYSADQIVAGLSDSNVTWYAQWTVNSYKLTVNPNGGTWNSSTSSQSFTQDYGTTKTIANPTRSGYRFDGWTKSGSGTINGTTFTFGAGACTLTAKWVVVYYLDLNVYVNGTSISSTTAAVADVYINGSKVASGVSDYYKQHDTGTKYEIKNIVVGSGYTQYSSSNLSGTLTAKTAANIYVGQNYTITYKSNGGTGSDQTQSVHYGTSWTTKGTVFSRTGYTLSSWNTAANGSGTKYNLNASQSSAQTSGMTLYAQWTINSYTNTIGHWLSGFINQEGNNTAKTMYRLNTTSFSANYNSSFTMDSSRAATVPNGCYLNSEWATSYISGSWENYELGISVTQKASALSCDYYYYPTTYTITYNLDGGINSEKNPSTYNVLYGFSLTSPKKDGYLFLGWYNGNTKITGVNEGGNATFSSVNDLYSKLASRTTGNITLTAKWRELTPDEMGIYIYNTGVCEAIEFNENDEFVGFQNGSKVNALQFVEDEEVKISQDKAMHFKEIKERFS